MLDPGFRSRLLKALAYSMVISGIFGAAAFGAVSFIPSRTKGADWEAVFLGMNTAAVVFWVAFVHLFLATVYKTAAVLDMDRRVRLAEDLFKRGRRP